MAFHSGLAIYRRYRIIDSGCVQVKQITAGTVSNRFQPAAASCDSAGFFFGVKGGFLCAQCCCFMWGAPSLLVAGTETARLEPDFPPNLATLAAAPLQLGLPDWAGNPVPIWQPRVQRIGCVSVTRMGFSVVSLSGVGWGNSKTIHRSSMASVSSTQSQRILCMEARRPAVSV